MNPGRILKIQERMIMTVSTTLPAFLRGQQPKERLDFSKITLNNPSPYCKSKLMTTMLNENKSK